MTTKIEDTEPVIKSRHGTAWKLDFPVDPAKPDAAGPTMAMWVLHVPWAHPIWKYYTVSLIHLRTMVGFPDALKYSPEAGYEVMVFALDPGYPVLQGEPPHWLQPQNFVGQFAAKSDEAAIEYVVLRLHEVCDGALSPDTDFQRDWVARFPFVPESERPFIGGVH